MSNRLSSKAVEVLEPMSAVNGGAKLIQDTEPYRALVEITGVADLILHRYNCDAVEVKSKSKKGSETKKTDDLESYVYRDDKGHICLPGTYIYGSMTDKARGAARYMQDPRSPRKSAVDLFRAGIVVETTLAKLNDGVKEWGYVLKTRVIVNGSAIPRMRPSFVSGWKARFVISVILAEYITPEILRNVIQMAGKFVGIADWRPTYGRFDLTHFEILKD